MGKLIKRKFEVIEFEDYYLDTYYNNKISKDKLHIHEAKLILQGMRERNNYNCTNCSYCINCIDCVDSHFCINCSDLKNCHFCIELHDDFNRHKVVGEKF